MIAERAVFVVVAGTQLGLAPPPFCRGAGPRVPARRPDKAPAPEKGGPGPWGGGQNIRARPAVGRGGGGGQLEHARRRERALRRRTELSVARHVQSRPGG